ncbi:MAG: IPT/TIG domain-containing protein [Trueperaceae bacterium]
MSAVAPEVAARGQAFTVTGTGFGTAEGTLTVGGVPASITSWGPTSIEATVPADAANAWQDVLVTTAGSAIHPGPFVGVAYTGTDADLQAFLNAQEAGTAVLLAARTYDLTAGAAALTVTNLELHGRGADATRLQLDATNMFSNEFDHSLNYDLQVLDSTIAGATIQVYSYGNTLFDTATVDMASGVRLIFYLGSLAFRNSSVTGDDVDLGASTGAEITDSVVVATDDTIWLRGDSVNVITGSSLAGGHVTIRGSTLRSLDADLTDSFASGSIHLSTNGAPILLENNPSIVAQGSIVLTNEGRHLGLGGVRVVGNEEIRVGVFTEDDAANFRVGSLHIDSLATTAPVLIEVANNALAFTGTLTVEAAGPRQLVLRDNTGSMGDPNTSGGISLVGMGQGPITITGNQLQATGTVSFGSPDMNNELFEVADNTFRVVGPGPSRLYAVPTNGTCRFTGNSIEVQSGAGGAPNVTVGCSAGTGTATLDFIGNEVSVTGTNAQLHVAGPALSEMLVEDNVLTSSHQLMVYSSANQVVVSGNEFHLQDYFLALGDYFASPTTVFRFEDNLITQRNPDTYGIYVTGAASVTLENNEATVLGTPGANVVALGASAVSGPLALTARNNTFTNYSRALLFMDDGTTQNSLPATVTNNVFDFPIDALAKPAELNNIGNAINATNNQWGTNTDAAVVEGYVYLSGNTVARGGTISIAPIKLPPAP